MAGKKTSTLRAGTTERFSRDAGKMQTVYLRSDDIDRANELEYRIKKSRSVPGRIGLSLVLRAGLKLLEAEFAKSERRALELVAATALEGRDPAPTKS